MKTAKLLTTLILSLFLFGCAGKLDIYRNYDSKESTITDISIVKGGNNNNAQVPRFRLYDIDILRVNGKSIPKSTSIYLEPGAYVLEALYTQFNGLYSTGKVSVFAEAGKTYTIIGILKGSNKLRFKVITTNSEQF
jgi:hypothetical protein